MEISKKSWFPNFSCTQSQDTMQVLGHETYGNIICKKLFSAFEKDELTDYYLIASDGVKFKVHKIVLAAGSDFFAAMLASPLKDSKNNEFTMKDINSEMLKTLLVYIYTGCIELQVKSINDILSVANFYQIKPLVEVCLQFMEQEMQPYNCLGIALFAEHHYFEDLYKKSIEYACTHFEQVSQEDEFVKLDKDSLAKILSNDELSVSTEETVFLAISKWIQYDKPEREKYTLELFSQVQYWYLSPKFIKQNQNDLLNDVKTAKMFCYWLTWHLSPDRTVLKTRKYSGDKLVVVFKEETNNYDPLTNSWLKKSHVSFGDFQKVIAVNDKFIYNSGTSLMSFDLQTSELMNIPQFEPSRTDFSFAGMQNELYVVGGTNRNIGWTKTVQKFNFNLMSWENVTPMPKLVFYPKIAVHGELMYVKGKENIIAIFDSIKNQWTLECFPFNRDISTFNIAAFSERLFIVEEQSERLCIYEYWNKKWKLHQVQFSLSNSKCIKLNNKLCIWGKCDTSNVTILYNPENETWQTLPNPFETFTSTYEIISISNK